MAINIIENLLTPEVPKMLDSEQIHVYVPMASYTNVGIASYDSDDFIIVNNKVSVKTATDTIRGLASFGLEFTVVNGHVQLSTSFYDGIDNKIVEHNDDDSTHAPAINKKIKSHDDYKDSHVTAFNQHNTVVGKHAQDHTNTLNNAKTYSDNKLNAHNTDNETHSDIRQAIVNTISSAATSLSSHNVDHYAHRDRINAVINIAMGLHDEISNALDTHKGSEVDHTDIRGTLLYILAVLQGKSRTFVIETLDQLVYFLANNSGVTVPMVNEQTGASEQISLNILDLRPGDTFLIRDRSVPDFWWDNTITDMWYPIDAETDLTGIHPDTGAIIGGMQILETDYAVVDGYLASASLKATEAKEYRDEAKAHRDSSESFSNLSRKYTEGKDLNDTIDPEFIENNAKYFKEQAKVSSESAKSYQQLAEQIMIDYLITQEISVLDTEGNPIFDTNADVIRYTENSRDNVSPQLTYLMGVGGTITLLSTGWLDYTYPVVVNELGNNDAIFFTPATIDDKRKTELAGISVFSNGSNVNFNTEIVMTEDITFNYFVTRGSAQ